jgi:hypothetical protein
MINSSLFGFAVVGIYHFFCARNCALFLSRWTESGVQLSKMNNSWPKCINFRLKCGTDTQQLIIITFRIQSTLWNSV